MSGFQNVIDALEAKDFSTQEMYGYVMASCPSHMDNKPSLSIKEGDDGRALVHCFAGCETADVVSSLGLDFSDLFTTGSGSAVADAYVYEDEDGRPLIRVLRLSPKGFTQQHYDGHDGLGTWKPGARGVRKVLYRLPDVLKWAKAGETIYVVEGEKDAESLIALGYYATTNIGGAGKWRDDYPDALRGAEIILVGDNDEPGRESIEAIGASLTAAGLRYEVRFPATGKDITEHLASGQGVESLAVVEPDLEVFQPFSWEGYETPEISWLYEPYVPVASRVLAFGAAGSLKSLWAMWVAARLSNEGHRVAYFSLEMSPSELAKRIKACKVNPDTFSVFTRFNMNSPQHVMYAIRALQGYSLIVIDSWSSAHTGADNDEVARLDNEVFKPIIEQTGATLLILDNTGHDLMTEKGPAKTERARGASAKGDKMDYSLFFDRPVQGNNYRCCIKVKKVRIDYPAPKPETFETSRGDVEFYRIKEDGTFGPSAWSKREAGLETNQHERDGSAVSPAPQLSHITHPRLERSEMSTDTQDSTDQDSSTSSEPVLTSAEKRALARIKDTFKGMEPTPSGSIGDEQ